MAENILSFYRKNSREVLGFFIAVFFIISNNLVLKGGVVVWENSLEYL